MKHTPGILKLCTCPKRDRCDHDWQLRFKPAGGKRVWLNLTQHFGLAVPMTAEAVEPWAVKGKEELRAGIVRSKSLTVADLGERYRAERVKKGKDYQNEGLCAAQIPGPKGTTITLGDKLGATVTRADLFAALAWWQARPKAARGNGGNDSRRKFLASARHFLNWSIKRGHLERTPFRQDGVAMIDVGQSRKRSRILQGDEEARLLAAADPYTADLMNAALETGARSGALRLLVWSDIGADAVVFRAEIQKDKERLELPITPTLRAILDRRKIGPDGVKLPASAFVFGNEIGEYVPGERAGELWRATCEAAGVVGLWLHDLRRSMASDLNKAGESLGTTRDVLGHSSTVVTDRYIAVQSDDVKKAVLDHSARRARRRLKIAR